MNLPDRCLWLVVPGLLPAWPVDPATDAAAPALARVLARARRLAWPAGQERALLALFGWDQPDCEPPVAALTAAYDLRAHDDAVWLRLDPVQVQADMRRVHLREAGTLQLTQDDAFALLASINAHLQADGLQVRASHPLRWHLQLPAAADLRAPSPACLHGCEIAAQWPAGSDRRRWQRLLTEIQLLLHDHPVNQRRMQAGLPLVNGVWPWGLGTYPRGLRAPASVLLGEDPLLAALGQATDSPMLDAAVSGQGDPSASLVVLWDACRLPAAEGDLALWTQAVQALDRAWIGSALDRLRNGHWRHVRIITDAGCCLDLDRWRLWQVWRRKADWSVARP